MKKFLFIFLLFPLLANASIPTVTTTTITTYTKFTAVCGGNVTSDGGVAVTSRGVVWSTNVNPTIAFLRNKLASGSGLGTYSITIAPLLPNTIYHVRAYAINADGIAYGADVTVTTTASDPNRGWYFSSSTGNDNTGNGTISAPYQTLKKLQSLSSLNNVTFQPGDSILFKRGDTFANGYDGTTGGFTYVSCAYINDPSSGYTAASGTAAKPIIWTGYGIGAKPNFYFPTASMPIRGGAIQHNVFEIAGVSYVNIDGLNFIDTRWNSTNHSDPAYTRGGILFGEWHNGYNLDSNARVYVNDNCIVRNCRFENISFALQTCSSIHSLFEYDTMINMMSCVDTFGVHDIMAGSFEGINGYYNEYSHNYIESSWGKSGRNSSCQGMGGVAFDMFCIKYSKFAYNTIIDCRHVMEIGNLDLNDSTSGSQYDTFAFNKCIDVFRFGYLHGGANDPFIGNVHNISIWNNAIIENNSARQSGINFGYDRKGDGTDFNQFWFFGNKNLTTGYNVGYGNFTSGVNSVTNFTYDGNIPMPLASNGMIAGNSSTGSQIAGYDDNPYLPETPMAWVTTIPSTYSFTASQNFTASGIQQKIIFFPPLNMKGITWSQPPNVSSSGYYNNWDNSNGNTRFTVQYTSDNTLWGRGYDTLLDLRNNIFYNTTGLQMLPVGFNRLKHSNNIYYVKGGFTYTGAATYTNLTRMGGALGTGEYSTITRLFTDTTASLPENWNLLPPSGALSVNAGISISGFTKDFAGNNLTNPPSIGLYNYTAASTIPTLTTTAAYSITSNSAISGGNITSNGGSPIIRRGIVWNTFPITDTLGNPMLVDANNSIGSYNLTITSLVFRTYYVLAFAVNANGVAYGNLVQFQTLIASPPSLYYSGTILGSITATPQATVYSEGSNPVVRKGFIYSTSPLAYDTTQGTKVAINSTGTGLYSISLSGLALGTTYYIIPWASSSIGVGYGAMTSFITKGYPSVVTTAATSITAVSAITGGSITDYGASIIYQRAVIYSTSPISDTNSRVGGGIVYNPNGAITVYPITLTSLLPNTLYYYRAFVVNEIGLGLGNQLTFTTSSNATLPIVTNISPTSITSTSSIIRGEVKSDGNASVYRRGFVYSTSHIVDTTSITGGGKIINGSGVGTYNSTLTSLTPNTTYYVVAFAINSVGVSYSSEIYFSTSATPVGINSFRTRKRYIQKL